MNRCKYDGLKPHLAPQIMHQNLVMILWDLYDCKISPTFPQNENINFVCSNTQICIKIRAMIVYRYKYTPKLLNISNMDHFVGSRITGSLIFLPQNSFIMLTSGPI